MLSLARCSWAGIDVGRELAEECEPHLTSLSVDDVQTGRGSRILAHGFAIISVF